LRKVPNFANRDALGPLAKLSQIYTIMVDISNGVAFIHGCGYIHRDLSPKNGTYPVYNLVDRQFCIPASKSSGRLPTLVFQQMVPPILGHTQSVGEELGFIANPNFVMGVGIRQQL